MNGPLVVYFYPSAFISLGASVIGVFLDSIERLNGRPSLQCGSEISVASDVDGKIARPCDLTVSEAKSGLSDSCDVEINLEFAERTTFTVTQDGRIFATIGGVVRTGIES